MTEQPDDDQLLLGSLDELMAVSVGSVQARDAAQARGREYIDALSADGTLLDPQAARRLGAHERGANELVTFKHCGETFYLACSLDVPASVVVRINRALGTVSNAARLLWWIKPHGALRGATVPHALRDGRLARCLELAEGYAAEHGNGPPRAEHERLEVLATIEVSPKPLTAGKD